MASNIDNLYNDIRKWLPARRANLNVGALIIIKDANDLIMTKMRLKATRYLVSHINQLTTSNVPLLNDASRDMMVCHAGEVLGIRMHVSHIFEAHRTALADEKLSHVQLLGVCKADGSPAKQLYMNASYQLISDAWYGKLSEDDAAALEAELTMKPGLAKSKKALDTKWQTMIEAQTRVEKRRVRKQAAMERVQRAEAAVESRVEARKDARDKVLAEKTKKEVKIRARALEEQRAGQKLDHDDAAALSKLYSKTFAV